MVYGSQVLSPSLAITFPFLGQRRHLGGTDMVHHSGDRAHA